MELLIDEPATAAGADDSTALVRRITAIAGVAFLVLTMVPPLLSGVEPLEEASVTVDHLRENAAESIWSGWLGLVAAVAFALYGTGLAASMRHRAQGYLASIVSAGTAVACSALAIGSGTILVASLRTEDEVEDAIVPAVDSAYQAALIDLGVFAYTIVAAVGYALVVFAVGVAALRSVDMANWFGWLSLVVAIGLILPFGFAFLALYAAAVWIVLSLVVVRIPSGPSSPATVAAAA